MRETDHYYKRTRNLTEPPAGLSCFDPEDDYWWDTEFDCFGCGARATRLIHNIAFGIEDGLCDDCLAEERHDEKRRDLIRTGHLLSCVERDEEWEAYCRCHSA